MKIWRIVCVLALVIFAGCSGGGDENESVDENNPPQETTLAILYALDFEGGSVVVYRPSENGLGDPKPRVMSVENPIGFIIDPKNNYFYVMYLGLFSTQGYKPNNIISQYNLGATGNLMEGQRFTLGERRGPGVTVFTSDGKFIYVADPAAYKIYSFSMDGEGIWSPINEISTPLMPIDIAIHPGNKFLYVANMGADSLQLYQIEINGALTLLGTTAQVSNQMDIEFTAEGAHAYITTSVGDIVITDVNTNTGTFSSSQRLMIEENGLGGIIVNVAKKFAYTLNCPLKQVTAYKIQASADLLKVGKLILDECPITITLDENKNTAYLATLNRSEIIVLNIEEDGNLTKREVVPTNYIPRQLLLIRK